MKKLLIISLLMITSCVDKSEHLYTIYGEKVICRSISHWNCGLSLNHCNNGKSYTCMTNLQEEDNEK